MTIASAASPPSKVAIHLGPVQETMLITLWARAVESLRMDAITRDLRAVEIYNAIDYDFKRFERGWKSQVGVAVRDRYIDDLVGRFIARHPHARIINLGAGLDTRFFRLDNGRLRWVDIDLPDAIDLRRRFIHETDRLTFMTCSASDFQWLDQLQEQDRRPTMLIAEGVLMFFDKKDVLRLLDRFARDFPASEMIFDLIGPLMVRFPFLHDTLPQTRARFRWGLRSQGEIGTWSEQYDLVSVRSMLLEHPSRWRWMKWCRFVPALRRQFIVVNCRCSNLALSDNPYQGRVGRASRDMRAKTRLTEPWHRRSRKSSDET